MVTDGQPSARLASRAAVSGEMPSAGMPSPLSRPDEPATTWPARGPPIRKPTAPLARAMSYLRRRWIVPAANISSWRTSTMRPLISPACSANSSGVPRPRSITSAVSPWCAVAIVRTSG
jgi:hypothetical protein